MDKHLNSRNSPFKYNGKEFDEETGNYYYGARYYDPKWSIWLSVDPLVHRTMNAYGYCYRNPINLIDPNGMEASEYKDPNDPPKPGEGTLSGRLEYVNADGSPSGIPKPPEQIDEITVTNISPSSGESSSFSNFWNSAIMRLTVKDTYSIGLSSNVAAFLGIGFTPINFTMLTRGERHILENVIISEYVLTR